MSGGGTITPAGLFTALAAGGGPFTVTASGGGVSGAAKVTVIGNGNGGTVTLFSLPGDGRVRYFGDSGLGQAQWDTVHDAASGNEADATSAGRNPWVGSGAYFGPTQAMMAWTYMRGYLAFDTSALPANAVITGATVGVFIIATDDSINDGNDYIAIVQGLQASGNTLAVGDYSKAGNAIDNPTQGSNKVFIPTMTVNGYDQWTLNAAGLAWIASGGVTTLAVREGHDLADVWPGYTPAMELDRRRSPDAGDFDGSLPADHLHDSDVDQARDHDKSQSQTVNAGQTETFTAAASGSPARPSNGRSAQTTDRPTPTSPAPHRPHTASPAPPRKMATSIGLSSPIPREAPQQPPRRSLFILRL